MNLEELKKQANAENEKKEIIGNLQEEVIAKFEEFFTAMDTSYPLWNAKMKETVNMFVADFEKYFSANGFDIKVAMPLTDEQYGLLEATYKELKFILSNVNYDQESFGLLKDGRGIAEFTFGCPEGTPNYFAWKDLLVVNKTRLVDMNGNVKDIYKKFVSKFTTEEELKLLEKKIEINIKHFQDAIEAVNDTDLCIFCETEKGHSVCKDFAEFIAQIG
mgnify:FL=1